MYEFAVTPAVTQLRRAGVIITEITPESLAELVGQPEVELSQPVLDDAALRHAFDQLFRHWNAAPTADEYRRRPRR